MAANERCSGDAGAIPVGIGACLAGQAVRFNALTKRPGDVLKQLAAVFEFRPFCPEVAIGLGVPRPPIRLVGPMGLDVEPAQLRAVDSDTGAKDVTEALRAQGRAVIEGHPDLCGYVLVKGSPSCGLERVKRYGIGGQMQPSDGVGIFAQALLAADPLLPVEEDGRLNDDHLRESFVARVHTYRQWKQLLREGLTHHKLLRFYASHKYAVMAHCVQSYRAIGRLLADAGKQPLQPLAEQVIAQIMAALKKPATRRGHTNVLEHIRGYLKRQLSAEEKEELSELIAQYRTGVVPLVVPLTLLRHHFRRHPDAYIEQQIFMRPYPDALRLRNAI